ncbi:HAD-IIB family hydrolase [Marivita geojedonensis]|uniref:Mannosyl-3-phosphoglycerate phosphatase n=1 Tax=Marivita geojedonensis TaxID=1123756 RepID=A0A1X4NKW9_9RHOB|nr:HAD-IIB family hydrolase [Marivita geojedonensis]OSQ50901.1 mannosyl-3-phosphoglycerate phosphatase [Marivita geojedonensis]PRY77402.1 mannosyl-3-phosphoglycerate phosphatase [Marivita geojedonensis]
MQNPPKLAVFSDLDGTLLDHDTYSWADAQPALARLAARGIPVVLTSSKTAAEIVLLQEEMGLMDQPAIVENGSGIVGLPGQADNSTYSQLRMQLDELPDHLRSHFIGFGDMTTQEVALHTGLSPDAAKRAQDRAFSEPGIWSGSDDTLADFRSALADQGIVAQHGGRFLTLSFGRTKADAMHVVSSALAATRTVALGDAPNDITMLQAADQGVIVANPHRPVLPPLEGEAEGHIIRTRKPGPKGWNEAINALLDGLDYSEGANNHG